jgi:hypothetical protein
VTPVKLYATNERPWAIPAACALESGLSVSRVAAAAAHVDHVGRDGVPGGSGVQVSQLLMQRPWPQVQGTSGSAVDAAKDNGSARKTIFGASGVPPRGRPV